MADLEKFKDFGHSDTMLARVTRKLFGKFFLTSNITDGTDDLEINADGSINADVDINAGSKVIVTDGTDDAAINFDGSFITRITDSTNVANVVTNAGDDTDIDDTNGLVTASHMYARLNDTTVKPVRMDASTHTIPTMSYEHHEIHGGSHYFVCNYQNLAINNVLDFTWQMPNTTKWIHWTWAIETESETLWQVYEGATATNPLANTVTPYNNNRNSANTSDTTMKFELQANLAAANADTDVTGATLLEQGIVGSGKRSLGQETRDKELVMDQNSLYCLRATAIAAGYINFCMQWYEHVDKN